MKKTLLVVYALGMMMLLFACQPTTKMYEYSDFADRHIVETDQQLSQPELEYYIYFYQMDCTGCLRIKQEALRIISRLEHDVVYFVVAESLQDVQDGVGVTQTPSLVKVENGTVTEIYVEAENVLEMVRRLN